MGIRIMVMIISEIDRGADLHPFIGYNYRISELHAAVGLAQFRKAGYISYPFRKKIISTCRLNYQKYQG